MAQIIGISSGMTPSADIAYQKPVRQYTTVEFKCHCCDGVVIIRNKKKAAVIDREQFKCDGCFSLFGRRNVWSMNELSYEDTVDKLSKLTDNSWVFCKHDRKFACATTGRSLEMQSGDIFKVVRIGTQTVGDTTYKGSIQKFTIDISFGSQVVTLFTHEFIEVSWMTIMDAAKAGEIKYTYLEQNDQWGVYEPTNDEIRYELQAMLTLAR